MGFTFLLLLLSPGCAGRGGIGDIGVQTPEASKRVEGVPIHPQTAFECGPAALAGVLNFHGVQVEPEEIAQAIFRKDLRGTVTLDMILHARQRGLSADWYSGSVEDIQKAVDRDIPLITMVDYGFLNLSRYHYLVVVGYTPEGILAHTGRERESTIKWEDFLPQWERTEYWTLRIEPQNGIE
jgi:ABC-type bacteriocin/lantibiotic exporter with double-glycine peptidase domain